MSSVRAIGYSNSGNIVSQTGIGRYFYDDPRPHAVSAVENTGRVIPLNRIDTQYNAFGKIAQIVDGGPGMHRMAFDYGPDNERWRTQLFRDSTTLRRTAYYWGDYEEIIENGVTRKLYYLDGNVLYKKQTNCPDSLFYIFTDHLGSVVAILDQNGGEKFRASYDAWGNQAVTRNDLGFHRGYTGHEMLPEFGLINMNGRLYDPQIGRFLSTDNYVQEPWNSQNFNRYSYCLNNPLKYTDSSGELFGIDDALAVILIGAAIGGAVNLGVKAYNGQINSWGDGFAAFGIGAAAGAICAITGGAAFTLAGGAAGGAGGFLAGAFGGAVGAATSMPIQSVGNHMYFGDPLMTGNEYLIAIGTSALLGGAINGGMAKFNGRTFWEGRPNVHVELTRLEPVPISSIESKSVHFDTELTESDISRMVAETNALKIPNEIPNTYSVYVGKNENRIGYVGITKRNPEIRIGEHLRSNSIRNSLSYNTIKSTGNYSSIRAHILEQKIINYYKLQKNGGLLYNKINSLAPKKWPLYQIK